MKRRKSNVGLVFPVVMAHFDGEDNLMKFVSGSRSLCDGCVIGSSGWYCSQREVEWRADAL